MRYEYIEPLVVSTKKVLHNVLDAEISGGDISLERADAVDGEISILIRVKGDSEGSIIVSLGRDTATQICAVMSGADGITPATLEMDTIAELSNMIAGNATSALNDLGYDFAVFPPTVVARTEILEKTSGVEIFRVPLGTPCGEISINVALKTN